MAAATAARSPEYPVFAVADCSTRALVALRALAGRRQQQVALLPIGGRLVPGLRSSPLASGQTSRTFTLPGNGPDNRPLFGIDVVGEIDKFWGKMVCPQILWINEWENALPTLRPSENHT